MTIDPSALREVEAATGAIRDTRPVSGGSISAAARVDLEDGATVFVKAAPEGAPAAMLEEEARSLARLRLAAESASSGLVVPSVVAAGRGWLALEWLDAGSARRGDWDALGRGLANLHGAPADVELPAAWGWDSTNFIGPLEQRNQPMPDWVEFWRTMRLLPQVRRAAGMLDGAMRRTLDQVTGQLDDIIGLAPAEPALLHGDLWNGNVLMTHAGPALVDPASYYGDGEVDLAMAALFGGFDAAFERAYQEVRPLRQGHERRRAAYQLYYLLVHVNLFGAAYVSRTREAARRALG